MYQAPPKPIGLVAIDISSPDPVGGHSPIGGRYTLLRSTHVGAANCAGQSAAEAADDRCLADTLRRLARGPRRPDRPDFAPARSALAFARGLPGTAAVSGAGRMPQPASSRPRHAYVPAALPKLLRQLEVETAVFIRTTKALREQA